MEINTFRLNDFKIVFRTIETEASSQGCDMYITQITLKTSSYSNKECKGYLFHLLLVLVDLHLDLHPLELEQLLLLPQELRPHPLGLVLRSLDLGLKQEQVNIKKQENLILEDSGLSSA